MPRPAIAVPALFRRGNVRTERFDIPAEEAAVEELKPRLELRLADEPLAFCKGADPAALVIKVGDDLPDLLLADSLTPDPQLLTPAPLGRCLIVPLNRFQPRFDLPAVMRRHIGVAVSQLVVNRHIERFVG